MIINERNTDMSVKIIVDSTADLNEAIKDQVAIVPLTICFGEEEYVDGVTITHHQFYEKLVESDILPTTSQASPSAFMKVFDEVLGPDDSAVVLTISSKLSGTCQSALIAAAEYPNVHVVDGSSAAIGSGILAEYALWLCLFILIAGVLGTARIILQHHTLGEVLVGFAVGLICSLLVLHPLSNILFRIFLF